MTKLLSFLFGILANFRFPPFLQRFINAQYVRIFRIDLSEFAPLYTYKSLNELFTRGLRQKRRFDKDKNIYISPVDSVIMESGVVKDGRALQIKGFSYSVERLVGQSVERDLSYASLYLSPRDYHRYHAPCDMYVESITHFKGALYPVHAKSLRKHRNLFVLNERVVLKVRDSFGSVLYFVAVGALNVGSMVFYIEPRIQNKHRYYKQVFVYPLPKFIAKGEEIGMFKMGSTIVLFAQNVDILQETGKIAFGDSLFGRRDSAIFEGEENVAR